MVLTRTQRRWIRITMSLATAIGAKQIATLSYIPDWFNKDFVETCAWLATVFAVVNPFLDLGSDDAKNDTGAPK
jgi:hypothetical protein